MVKPGNPRQRMLRDLRFWIRLQRQSQAAGISSPPTKPAELRRFRRGLGATVDIRSTQDCLVLVAVRCELVSKVISLLLGN